MPTSNRPNNISYIDEFINKNITGGSKYCIDSENTLHIFMVCVLGALLLCVMYIIYMKFTVLDVPKSIIPVIVRLQ